MGGWVDGVGGWLMVWMGGCCGGWCGWMASIEWQKRVKDGWEDEFHEMVEVEEMRRGYMVDHHCAQR